MNSKHHGKFVWYDLMTEDMKAAGNFYREVIGWGVQVSAVRDGPTRCSPRAPRWWRG